LSSTVAFFLLLHILAVRAAFLGAFVRFPS
jgi:hypothetical protein